MQKNFYDKLRGIKSQIRLWSWRGLSLFGKVTIIKTLLLPKVLYVSTILPPPLEFIKAFQTITYNFLPWIGPHFPVILTRLTRTRITQIPRYLALNFVSLNHNSPR